MYSKETRKEELGHVKYSFEHSETPEHANDIMFSLLRYRGVMQMGVSEK